jgi:hypothetical protein
LTSRDIDSAGAKDKMSSVLSAYPRKHLSVLLINGGDETQVYALQLAPILESSNALYSAVQ